MRPDPTTPFRRSRQDPWIVRWTLTLATFAIVAALIVIPLVSIFAQAPADVRAYWVNLVGNADTRHSSS